MWDHTNRSKYLYKSTQMLIQYIFLFAFKNEAFLEGEGKEEIFFNFQLF